MITIILNLGMNYVNYKMSIILKYHVQLVGWPSEIPFINPYQLMTITSTKSLLDSLTVSMCKWVILSKQQQKDHAAALAASAEGGQVVGRKRKVCLDKGRKRGKLADSDDDSNGKSDELNDDGDENERPTPAKKKKKQESSASYKKRIASAKKSNATTTFSKSAKKSKGVAKNLPPVALKSKEFIDTEDNSNN